MDVSALKDFVVLAESTSFTKAAAAVNTTQSNLSKRMAVLEGELGFRLFLRNARGVSLTKAGAVFYREVVEMLSRLDGGIEKARAVDAALAPFVTIGGYFANTRMLSIAEAAAARAITAKLPFGIHVDRSFIIADGLTPGYIEPSEALADGVCDMILAFVDKDFLLKHNEALFLYRDPFAVFLSCDSGYENGQSIDLGDLAEFAFIETSVYGTYNRRIAEVCEEIGFSPMRRRRYYDSMTAMVEQCSVDEVVIVPDTIAYRIPGPHLSGMVRVYPTNPNAYFEVFAVGGVCEEKQEIVAESLSVIASVTQEIIHSK